MPTIRQALATLLVIFIIYAVLTTPTQSADVTNNAWGRIENGVSAVGTFFDGLLSR